MKCKYCKTKISLFWWIIFSGKCHACANYLIKIKINKINNNSKKY